MSTLLDILKPHFFPHYSCFQYGVGAYELWLSRHCLQYIVATDYMDDYEFLLDVKEGMSLPALMPYLAPPDEYHDCILRFGCEHFNLIYVYIAPPDFTAMLPEILLRLKVGGVIVLPSGQMSESLVDYEEIGEGVYRKPNGK